MKGVILSLILVPAIAAADTARIATWNLGGFNQIPQHKLENIIEGIKLLDADILVLPELNPLSHGDEIAEQLSADGDCYKSIVPDQPRARQEIGFIFKCEVQVFNSGMVVGSDLDKQGYRNSAVISVKIEEYDFVVIGLHLKAGRGAANRDLRDEQLAIINGYVQGILMTGEKDVLVIGDYNMIPIEDEENFDTLNTDDSMQFVSSEDLIGQGSHISGSGSSAHTGNLLDGYGFTNVDDPEYKEGTLKIVQLYNDLGLTLGEFKSEVTDHLPLVAEFETGVDAD